MAASTLAACGTTYGTGVGTTVQTMQDMVNLIDLRQDDPIVYQARPGLVAPPTYDLPPPVTCDATEALSFVGERLTNRRTTLIQNATRAAAVRVLRPDDIATADVRLDRVTIDVDAGNVIIGIRCV